MNRVLVQARWQMIAGGPWTHWHEWEMNAMCDEARNIPREVLVQHLVNRATSAPFDPYAIESVMKDMKDI